jgi:hypothetical protein
MMNPLTVVALPLDSQAMMRSMVLGSKSHLAASCSTIGRQYSTEPAKRTLVPSTITLAIGSGGADHLEGFAAGFDAVLIMDAVGGGLLAVGAFGFDGGLAFEQRGVGDGFGGPRHGPRDGGYHFADAGDLDGDAGDDRGGGGSETVSLRPSAMPASLRASPMVLAWVRMVRVRAVDFDDQGLGAVEGDLLADGVVFDNVSDDLGV